MVWICCMGLFGYFYFKNKDEYFKLCAMLFTGMTVFLVISTIYPNGHYLRPAYFEHNNIFIQMVKWLYATDTPTNLFPSVHVFNSIAVNIAVWHSDNFKKNKLYAMVPLFWLVLIILIHNVLKSALRFRRCHRYGTCRIYVTPLYTQPTGLLSPLQNRCASQDRSNYVFTTISVVGFLFS